MSLDLNALLRHAGELHRATHVEGLHRFTHEAVSSLTRYRHSWLALLSPEHPGQARMLRSSDAPVRQEFVPIAGDAMAQELIERQWPVVVVDAREDPRTNKALVKTLGNRTIVNIPLLVNARVIGSLGVGTYADEGPRAPTEAELETLIVLATQLANAIERIQTQEQQQREHEERHRLELRLESLQRVELLGLLASGLSHDLNNTLAVVASNLRSLDHKALSPDDREAVEDSMTATARAIDVVANLRALGKSRPSRREDIDLNARVVNTLRLVRSSIPVSVTLQHEAGVAPPVTGDPEQIDHALASLLIHARDAVKGRGLIRIHVDEQVLEPAFVDTHAWARPGRFARVVVHDSGPALPPAVLEQLADPHFLASPSAASQLGLAIAARVVRQHEGLLSCQSAEGDGTRLAIYLPATVPGPSPSTP